MANPVAHRFFLTAPIALVLAACGGVMGPVSSADVSPDRSSSASPGASAKLPSAVPSAGQSATPSASTGSTARFASTVYPYSLQLPPGVLTRNWRPATRAWDGQGRVATDTPNVDATGTSEGDLLVWGLPWDEDLADFNDLVAATMARFHGCSASSAAEPFTAGGVAGVGQRARCALQTDTVTAVMVKDGWGLIFRLRYDTAKEALAFPTLVRWLGGLSWEAR